MKKIFSILMAITMFMCAVGFVPVSAYTYDKQNEFEVKYNISYYSDGGLNEKAMIVRSVDELPHSEISLDQYDEEFFKDKFLILLSAYGDGDDKFRVISVTEDESTLGIDVDCIVDELGPTVVCHWLIVLEADRVQLDKKLSVHWMTDIANSPDYEPPHYYAGGIGIDYNTLSPNSKPYLVRVDSAEKLEGYTGEGKDEIVNWYNRNSIYGDYLLFVQWSEPVAGRTHEVVSAYYDIYDEESPITVKLSSFSLEEESPTVITPYCAVIEIPSELADREVVLEYDGNDTPPKKHIHKICGDEGCTDNHEDIEWTAWDSDILLPTEAGNYYLTKDVDLIEMWCPETAVNLCFNGHIVSCDWYRGAPDSAMIFYDLTDTIILTDCSDTEHKFSVGDRGNWVLDENGTKTLKGGAVINPNGYFAIRAFDTSVNMYNINITGSYGGILAATLNTDTLNMYNCTLAGNYGAEAMGIGNTANIRNCSIFENTGGGVYMGIGALNIGGKILIKDNRSNLYIYNADAVNIVEPLAEGSYIGVNKSADENVINVTSANDTDYSGFFYSDDENYKIVNGENNIIQLVYDKDSKAYPYTVTEITIFDSLGSKVSYIPKNKEGYAIGINVHKNAESDEDVFIICALYDKDGALMGVYPVKMQSSPEIIQYHEEIPAQEKVAGSIKVFVWDGCNSMKPLAEAKTMSFMGQ